MSNLILSTYYHKHDDNRLLRERGGLLLPVDPQTLATDWICSSCQVTLTWRHIFYNHLPIAIDSLMMFF